MKSSLRSRGYEGENIAKQFLLSLGYVFLSQNAYTPFGEIDLIFADKQTIVFVEVKLRRNVQFGRIVDQISPVKRRRWIKSAQFLLEDASFERYTQCRFDYVGILVDLHQSKDRHQITHIKNAFNVDDEFI